MGHSISSTLDLIITHHLITHHLIHHLLYGWLISKNSKINVPPSGDQFTKMNPNLKFIFESEVHSKSWSGLFLITKWSPSTNWAINFKKLQKLTCHHQVISLPKGVPHGFFSEVQQPISVRHWPRTANHRGLYFCLDQWAPTNSTRSVFWNLVFGTF